VRSTYGAQVTHALQPPDPMQPYPAQLPRSGAVRRGKTCNHEAGWGTDHVGWGQCKNSSSEATARTVAVEKLCGAGKQFELSCPVTEPPRGCVRLGPLKRAGWRSPCKDAAERRDGYCAFHGGNSLRARRAARRRLYYALARRELWRARVRTPYLVAGLRIEPPTPETLRLASQLDRLRRRRPAWFDRLDRWWLYK
jgi:hypothetical protein